MEKRVNNHRQTGSGGRPRSDAVTLQLTTTPGLVEVLDLMVDTGFFGNSRAGAASILLSEAVRGLLKEGVIQRRHKVFEPEKPKRALNK